MGNVKRMYNIEWRQTSAGWSMPYIDGDEVSTEIVKYAERCNALELALDGVIAEVKKWQENGRNGFCMPVLRGSTLENIEKLIHQGTTP
jgi:hypothetical protein